MSLANIYRRVLSPVINSNVNKLFSTSTGSNTNVIKKKITDCLQPLYCDVINESHNHNVPSGSGTHFRVIVVSPVFSGKSLVQRHRKVYEALDNEMKTGIHALALETYSPEEWKEADSPVESPPCKGGSKR